jgi:hypothetical protein
MRATVSWSIVLSPLSDRNCLGLLLRLWGQRRVPLPPAIISAYIGCCLSV